MNNDTTATTHSSSSESGGCSNTSCCPPQTTVKRSQAKIGRNDPCACGSEKKYKKCCGKNA